VLQKYLKLVKILLPKVYWSQYAILCAGNLSFLDFKTENIKDLKVRGILQK